jgi:glycine cleavage system aminomethyltransferase T
MTDTSIASPDAGLASATDPNHKMWAHSPWVPFDDRVILYDPEHWEFGAAAQAWEYTGWRDEALSWKTTASLHGHLNPSPTVRVSGPDAQAFLQSVCVNSYGKLQIGAGRHAVMTDDNGRVAAHGLLLRVAETEFMTYWLAPYLVYRSLAAQAAGMRFELQDLTGQVFLFQLGGPRSLEILEEAAQENLHDIAFLRHRTATIAGEPVRIVRIGMSATLAYEIHGDLPAAQKVYQAIYDIGAPIGIRKLGARTYMCNHTEGGFPQAYFHMPLPWGEDPDLRRFLLGIGFDAAASVIYTGSAGQDLSRRYRSPYDLGWGHLVKFNHDFPGRAALEQEAAAQRTTMVTLVWNAEDVASLIAASYFGRGEPVTPMPFPHDFNYLPGHPNKAQVLRADKVLVDGLDVGTSSGRTYTEWSHEVLSLATIATEYSAVGTDVVVLWGDEGTRQVEIRAKVARFPYLIDPVRNEHFDVSTIPSKFPPKH